MNTFQIKVLIQFLVSHLWYVQYSNNFIRHYIAFFEKQNNVTFYNLIFSCVQNFIIDKNLPYFMLLSILYTLIPYRAFYYYFSMKNVP